MAKEKVLKLGLVGLIIGLVISLLTSSLSATTPSGTNACKESMPGCTKKKAGDAKSGIELESFSGKFFSSLSY